MSLFTETEQDRFDRLCKKRLCLSTDLPDFKPRGDFVQGSSEQKAPSPIQSPQVKGWGIDPNVPPVQPISDETVNRLNYPSGLDINRPRVRDLFSGSLFGDGFMQSINQKSIEHKFNSLPPTPTVPPMPLSAEAVAAMDNVAANIPATEATAAANIPANSTILGREANKVLPKNVHFSNTPYYSDSIIRRTATGPSWFSDSVSNLSTSQDVNAANIELPDSSDEEEGPKTETAEELADNKNGTNN